MPEYLKKATHTAKTDASDVHETVQSILDEIKAGGDEKALEIAQKFDGYSGSILLSRDEVEAAGAKLSQRLKDDIRFAADNVRRFAEAQKATLTETEMEVVPGLIAGQKIIPVSAAGAYIPGGRYSHVASAIMTLSLIHI